jgi:hypothetical protein
MLNSRVFHKSVAKKSGSWTSFKAQSNMSSNNKPGAASASSSNSASSAGSGAARGKGGKGERGGKGGKVAKGGKGRKGGNDVTPISASSDAVAASNVALVKVFTENSAGFVVLEHEGPNGQLLADIRELARKMHAAGALRMCIH